MWPFLSNPGPEGARPSAKHFVYQIGSDFWDPGSDELKQATQSSFTSLQPFLYRSRGTCSPQTFWPDCNPWCRTSFFVVGMCAAFVYQHSVYVGHRSQSFGPILSEASSISSWHLNFSCRFQVRPYSNHLWPFLSDPGPEGASHSAKHFVYQISSYFGDPGSDEIKQATQTPFTSLQPCSMDPGALPAPRLFGTIATSGAEPVLRFSTCEQLWFTSVRFMLDIGARDLGKYFARPVQFPGGVSTSCVVSR